MENESLIINKSLIPLALPRSGLCNPYVKMGYITTLFWIHSTTHLILSDFYFDITNK